MFQPYLKRYLASAPVRARGQITGLKPTDEKKAQTLSGLGLVLLNYFHLNLESYDRLIKGFHVSCWIITA